MKCILRLFCLWLVLINCSYYSQDGMFTMSIEKIKNIYVFDGVSYDYMSLKEVMPKSVKASSTLESKVNAYKAENLLDHNNKTAWVEGQDDAGVGASVVFEFGDSESYPDVIEIVPGYAKDEKTWTSNTKPVSINVTFLNENMDENELIESFSLSFHFVNEMLPMKSQFVNISSMHLQNMALTEFKYIKFEVMEIAVDGAKYPDMCISTINFYKGDKVLENITKEEYVKRNP